MIASPSFGRGKAARSWFTTAQPSDLGLAPKRAGEGDRKQPRAVELQYQICAGEYEKRNIWLQVPQGMVPVVHPHQEIQQAKKSQCSQNNRNGMKAPRIPKHHLGCEVIDVLSHSYDAAGEYRGYPKRHAGMILRFSASFAHSCPMALRSGSGGPTGLSGIDTLQQRTGFALQSASVAPD